MLFAEKQFYCLSMRRNSEIEPGDVISVRFGGVLRHYGVVTLSGRVLSNSREYGGVIEQSLEEFASGRPIKRHRNTSGLHYLEIEARARRAQRMSYSLTETNCIDYVRRSHRQRPTAWQYGRATLQTFGDMFGRGR